MNKRTASAGFRFPLAVVLVIGLLLADGGGSLAAAADESVAPPATTEPAANPAASQSPRARTAKNVVPGADLDSMSGPLTRMVLSLLAVLAVLGACAWLARRVRGTQIQGGLIQIVSGLSLGPKEKVVLLRVGNDQVLVGLSAAGMQPLHVMGKSQPPGFSLSMADAAEVESFKGRAS